MPPPPEQALSIVGVTRFSVDPASIFETGSGSRPMATLQAALYDPVRLRHRFRLFRTFTFPSMVAAARRSRRFHYVILISPGLPSRYKDLLSQLCLRHPRWCHLRVIGPDERFSDVTCDALAALAAGDRVFNFRIDDDDAIRPDFVDKITTLSGGIADGDVVSFDLGYYVQRTARSTYYLHEMDYPKIAIGLGVFSAPEAPACIYDQGVHQTIPSERVTNVRDDHYWIRTLHAENDSGMRSKQRTSVELAELCTRLESTFGHLPLERALSTLPITEGLGADRRALRALFGIQ